MRRGRRKYIARDKGFTARRILMLLGIVVLVAATVVGSVQLFKKRDALGESDVLPFDADAKYAYTGNGFYYIKDGSLVYSGITDKSSDRTIALGSTDVSVDASKTLAVIYNSAAIHIIGTQYPVEVAGRILSVRCGSAHVAVLREDAGGNVALQVFDSASEQVASLDAGGGIFLDYGFSSATDGSEVLWTLCMDTSASAPVCTVTIYSYTAGSTSISGIMSVQGQLVEDIVYAPASVFAACTTSLIRYDKAASSESYRLLVYGYRLYDYTTAGAKPLFMYVPRADTGLAGVRLYGVSDTGVASESVSAVQLPSGTHSAFVAGGKLYAFTADSAYVYSASGAIEAQYILGEPCDAVVKLSDTHILIRRGSALTLVTLH